MRPPHDRRSYFVAKNLPWISFKRLSVQVHAGYVVKMDAESELLTAVDVVLRDEQFVGSRFAGHSFTPALDVRTPGSTQDDKILRPVQPQDEEILWCHEAGFYSDDQGFLDDVAQFIGNALEAGNPVIAVVTEEHRDSLLPRFRARGLDIAAAIEHGRYISLDAAEALSTFMINDVLDPGRFLKLFGHLIETAAHVVKDEQARVAIFRRRCSSLVGTRSRRGGHSGGRTQPATSQDIRRGYSVRLFSR